MNVPQNVFWAMVNPPFNVELEHSLPHVMMWAGMKGTHLFGPFFYGPVNGTMYEDML
jgi:hypothetical protein